MNDIGFQKLVLALMLLMLPFYSNAQKDVIIKKDSTELRCKILKESAKKYFYAAINSKNKVIRSTILKMVVDSVQYNKHESDLVANKLFCIVPVPVAQDQAQELVEPEKPWQYSFGLGLNLGNVIEYNSPSGEDKKSISATLALDLGLNYKKEASRFAMTNELHWNFAVQRNGLTSEDRIQRANDELSTLHDFSYTFFKKSNWNGNLIIKTNTSLITIYDGDYFADYNDLGRIQGFGNPYDVVLSPGIKYQPNDYLRISFSPYSLRLYGLTDQQIANTGYYIETFDQNGDYDLFNFIKLGAELNVWFDRKFKKWIEMQYRLGVSTDFFSDITKNGLVDGLFITKFKIIKNISLSHRATLKGEFFQKPFKPNYKQTILLTFSKSF